MKLLLIDASLGKNQFPNTHSLALGRNLENQPVHGGQVNFTADLAFPIGGYKATDRRGTFQSRSDTQRPPFPR